MADVIWIGLDAIDVPTVETLRAGGHAVHFANSADAAWRLIRGGVLRGPFVVVTHMRLWVDGTYDPTGGVVVAKTISERHPKVPVGILGVGFGEDVAEQARSAGAAIVTHEVGELLGVLLPDMRTHAAVRKH